MFDKMKFDDYTMLPLNDMADESVVLLRLN